MKLPLTEFSRTTLMEYFFCTYTEKVIHVLYRIATHTCEHQNMSAHDATQYLIGFCIIQFSPKFV